MGKKWLRIRELLEEVDKNGSARVDILYFSTFMDFIEAHDIWEDYDFEVKKSWLIITLHKED